MMEMTTNSFNQSNTTPDPAGNGTEESDDTDWDMFDELIWSFNTMSIVVYCLVSVLGVLGNGVVIWVTGFKMKTTVNTVWYLNLAVADFIFAAFLPLSVTSMAMGFHWPFGKFMCKLHTTLLLLNMFVSVYILVVISVDRCVSVVWPVWAQNHRNVRKASYVSLSVWVMALILKAPYIFFQDTEQESEDHTFCFEIFLQANPSVSQDMIIISFLLGFAVPFTVIVSCYAVIIHHLRRNRTLASQSRRSFKKITAIIVTFFFCWAPLHIMGLIGLQIFIFGTPSETLFDIFLIGLIFSNNLAVLNSCMNPVLYVFIRQDFKDQVRKSLLNVLESAFQEEEKHSPTEDQMEQTEL